MKGKRKSRGVTVVEMLIAVLLLALLTAGGVAATAAVMAVHNHMVAASNAEILASTVAEAITNEIRLGKNVAVTDDSGNAVATAEHHLTLDSVRFGAGATLELDSDGRLTAKTQVADSGGGTSTTTVQLLAETVYGELTLSELEFAPIKEGETVPPPKGVAAGGTAGRTAYTVSFTVESEQDGELWSGSVSAAPMQPCPTPAP